MAGTKSFTITGPDGKEYTYDIEDSDVGSDGYLTPEAQGLVDRDLGFKAPEAKPQKSNTDRTIDALIQSGNVLGPQGAGEAFSSILQGEEAKVKAFQDRNIETQGAPAHVEALVSLPGTDDPTMGIWQKAFNIAGYVGAKLERDPETGRILYSLGDGNRTTVDPIGLRPQNVANWIGSMGGEAITVSGEVTGGVGGAMSPIPGGATMGAFLGATAGHYMRLRLAQAHGLFTDEDMEAMRALPGVSDDPLINKAVLEGGVPTAMGAVVGKTLQRMFFGPTFSNKQINILDEETGAMGQAAIRAAQDLDLPFPPRAATAKSDFFSAMMFQTSQSSLRDPVGRGMTRAKRALDEAVHGVTRENLIQLRQIDVAKITKTSKDYLVSLMNRETAPGASPLNRNATRHALRRGMTLYKDSSKRLRNMLYNKARVLDDGSIAFDISELQRLLQGKAQGTPITLADGEVAQFGQLHPEIRKLTDIISNADPLLRQTQREDGEVFSSLDILQSLRRNIFDLRDHDDAVVRRQANEIWSATRDVMDKPISADGSGVALPFRNALKKANDFNFERESVLGIEDVTKMIGKKGNIDTKTLDKFTEPGHPDVLKLLFGAEGRKGVLPIKFQKQVRDGFKHRLAGETRGETGSGKRLVTMLDKWKRDDPEGLNLLLGGQKQTDEIFKSAVNLDQFERGPVQILQQNLTSIEQAAELGKLNVNVLRNLIRQTGGAEGAAAQTLRFDLHRKMLNASTVIDKNTGLEVIDPKKLIAQINQSKKSETNDQFMRPEDWRVLSKWRNYSVPLTRSSDVAGVLKRGEMVSKLTSIRPIKQVVGWAQVGKNDTLAALFALPASRNALRKFVTRKESSAMQIVGGAAGVMVDAEKALGVGDQSTSNFPQ